jgi:hypothetical protein
MAMGLVKGDGFAVGASVLEANARRYHGNALTNSIGKSPRERPRVISTRMPVRWHVAR